MKVLIKQGDLKLQFPITPQFSVSEGNNNVTVNRVGNSGDINLRGNKKLKEISVSGYFPKDNKSVKNAQYRNFPTGKRCIEILEEMTRTNGGLVYFLVAGVVKGVMTIETFDYELMVGGHYSFSMSLKEYQKPQLKHSKKNNSKNKINTTSKIKKIETKRTSKEYKTVNHTVKKGDTLSYISKKYTGSASNYLVIAKQNNIKNPHLIYPGQRLVIKCD